MHVVRSASMIWSYRLRQHNVISKIDPVSPYLSYRSRGRPLLRWDDHIRRFCALVWPTQYDSHWSDILHFIPNVSQYEEEYVLFITDMLQLHIVHRMSESGSAVFHPACVFHLSLSLSLSPSLFSESARGPR